MSLHCKCVTAAAVGATADTFESVGDIELRSDARMLYGFWVLAVPAVGEAAKAYTGQLRVSSGDLNLGQQIYPCPPYVGGAPATNIDFKTANAEFIPLVKACQGKEKISIEFSTNLPDPTNACSVVVGAVYWAGPDAPKGDVMAIFPNMAAVCGGCDTETAAAVTTVAETAITDLVIPAWAKEIVGFKQLMVPNLVTAGEEIAGFVRYRSSMPNFEPQEWPFVAGFAAPLGTPVGKGAEIQTCGPMAAHFPTTGKNETITPNVVLNVAITTGNPVVAAAYYR